MFHPLNPHSALPHPEPYTIAIVRSSYYEDLLSPLEESARRVLTDANIPEGKIQTMIVPGSFEIPLACQHFLQRKEVQGIIALGVIIQGETFHAGEIARSCTDGLAKLQLEYQVPIAHGVLFCKNLQQAQERCMGKENKGSEAARTVLRMIALLQKHP